MPYTAAPGLLALQVCAIIVLGGVLWWLERPQRTTAQVDRALPRSTASCPSCRGELDWDALALQARRSHVPLAFSLAVTLSFARLAILALTSRLGLRLGL